jgi:hypothetical protein
MENDTAFRRLNLQFGMARNSGVMEVIGLLAWH